MIRPNLKISWVCLILLALPLAQWGLGHPFHQQESSHNPSEAKCGYSSCPQTDPKRTNIHIIAHTHDDVGWLKTTDQYFYSTKRRYSTAGVQYILDSIVPQLMMDKSKRFIYVEMSFFTKWWDEQDEQMRNMVKHLVNEGRLEFINGGWCMNDEATVTYHSTIEQMTLGLKFLNETFGQCGHPKVGWQIDPFGHTSEQASLFAQFGFDGMFFTRIGYQDKEVRTANKSLDIIWHGDRILQGQSGSIFTNIFRDNYDAPQGFCFDALCLDDPIVDNKKSYEFNVESKGKYMIEFMRQYAKAKMTNHVLIPFGGDFQFTAAGQNFKSLDKMIKYIRAHAPDLHIFYSTPSCYQYAVHASLAKERHVHLPEKYNDFMPYDSSSTVWWSGYFASRPSVKLIERETANLLQVARVASLANLLKNNQGRQTSNWVADVKQHDNECLRGLWEILGDLQHHDAVTGTEKQHVANDYVRRVVDARKPCARFIGQLKRQQYDSALRNLPEYEELKKSGKRFHLEPLYLEDTMLCPLLNISQCDALESDIDIKRYMNSSAIAQMQRPMLSVSHTTPLRTTKLPKEFETKSVLMTAHNPLAKQVYQQDFRLPCNGRCDLDKVQVIHLATNETLKLIRLPVPSGITTLPFRDAITNYEILFYANVPPLGSTSFVISDENYDEIVDEESYTGDSILITDESQRQSQSNTVRTRRIRQDEESARYEYFEMAADDHSSVAAPRRSTRDVGSMSILPTASDRVIVKFDMHSGVIVGVRRVSDGSVLNITQKFGWYYPAEFGPYPGAYTFRPNSTEPQLMQKPTSFRMYKRQNGALIEIHQKWSDWIWQTIRVDSRKNYIEFDYVVGPIPETVNESGTIIGREVMTRYMTNMANDGVFLTDSNARQLMPRHRLRSEIPTELGGSFFPVTSVMIIRNNKPTRSSKIAEAVSVLMDRAQGCTSLNEGDLELLIHRRQLKDDSFGVGEALNEPGEDGRGLVTRGRHRLYLKFHDQPSPTKSQPKHLSMFVLPKTPRANLTYEYAFSNRDQGSSAGWKESDTYIVHDQLLNDIRQESVEFALKPVLTFDRLRVRASEFVQMLGNQKSPISSDISLLNTSLPNNIHLLSLQPWDAGTNQLLIRLENLDNPLTIHPIPDYEAYRSSLEGYRAILGNQTVQIDPEDPCFIEGFLKTDVNLTYLIKGIRFTNIEEYNLGANVRLSEDKRLDWTHERSTSSCDYGAGSSAISLRPRQIRTFLATFEYL